jgi:hypothetical protein
MSSVIWLTSDKFFLDKRVWLYLISRPEFQWGRSVLRFENDAEENVSPIPGVVRRITDRRGIVTSGYGATANLESCAWVSRGGRAGRFG